MADVPEHTLQQKRGEQGTDKNCWHGKCQKEMDNDDMENEGYDNGIDDEESQVTTTCYKLCTRRRI